MKKPATSVYSVGTYTKKDGEVSSLTFTVSKFTTVYDPEEEQVILSEPTNYTNNDNFCSCPAVRPDCRHNFIRKYAQAEGLVGRKILIAFDPKSKEAYHMEKDALDELWMEYYNKKGKIQ